MFLQARTMLQCSCLVLLTGGLSFLLWSNCHTYLQKISMHRKKSEISLLEDWMHKKPKSIYRFESIEVATSWYQVPGTFVRSSRLGLFRHWKGIRMLYVVETCRDFMQLPRALACARHPRLDLECVDLVHVVWDEACSFVIGLPTHASVRSHVIIEYTLSVLDY